MTTLSPALGGTEAWFIIVSTAGLVTLLLGAKTSTDHPHGVRTDTREEPSELTHFPATPLGDLPGEVWLIHAALNGPGVDACQISSTGVAQA